MAEPSPYPPPPRASRRRRKYLVPAGTGLRHLMVRLQCPACGTISFIHEPGGQAVELDGDIHYSLFCKGCGRTSWMPATFHRPTVCAHLDLMNDHPSRLSSHIR